MAFLFTGFEGDSSLTLKSKEAFCLQVGDWSEIKVAFQCSLLPTGSFSSVSGDNGSSITGSIQSALSNRDFLYVGLKENNHTFPQSGLYNSSVSPSFFGNYVGYTNKTSLDVDANSVTSYQNPNVYFSPYLLYQSPNHSGINQSNSSFYLHNNNTLNVATNILSFVIGNENQTGQIIDCTYSSDTSRVVLGSGGIVDLLDAATINNKEVSWSSENGCLPNQIFIYNGMDNLYLRLHCIAVQKTEKQYSNSSIVNSGAFISFDNAVNSIVMETPHLLNQCQFFIGTGLSGVNSYINNQIELNFNSVWTGFYFDFSDMNSGDYVGELNTSDMLWYPSSTVNLTIT